LVVIVAMRSTSLANFERISPQCATPLPPIEKHWIPGRSSGQRSRDTPSGIGGELGLV
jgi:hypothetical protein